MTQENNGENESFNSDMNEWEGKCFAKNVLITKELLESFVELSGDRSFIHTDADYAKSRGFKDSVVHGALQTALISHVIDPSNSRSHKAEIIGQIGKCPIVFFVIIGDDSEMKPAFLRRAKAIQFKDSIKNNASFIRNFPIFDNTVHGIFFKPGHKAGSYSAQISEEQIIDIGFIENGNRAGSESKIAYDTRFVAFSFGDDRIIGKVTVVVKSQVQFDRSFSRSELCPSVHIQTQINHHCIYAVKLVLETKLPFLPRSKRLRLRQQRKEYGLVQFPRPMFVRIRQSRFLWCCDSRINQLVRVHRKSFSNLAHRVGSTYLTEQHRNKLLPAGKALGRIFCLMVANHSRKLVSINRSQQLAEQTAFLKSIGRPS